MQSNKSAMLIYGIQSRDVNFDFFQKSIFVLKKSIFFPLSNLVLCVALSTAAAVTLCARPYIAAAHKRTTDVRNAIRGIRSADRMRSL